MSANRAVGDAGEIGWAARARTSSTALIGLDAAQPARRDRQALIPALGTETEPDLESLAFDERRQIGVLLIDDDVLDQTLFSERLSRWGYSVSAHPSVEAAMAAGATDFDIVLIDLGLPGVGGWEGIKAVRTAQPGRPVIVLAGHQASGLAETAIDSGAHDFVWKDDPDADCLDRTIRRALRRSAFAAAEQFDALHDPLTGLPNRILLEDRMATLAALADRNGTKLGVLFIDLDDFKPVNDRYGHHVGDRLLIEVAGRIARVMRPSDTVARVGGDEFVALVGNAVDDRGVDQVARRLSRALHAPHQIDGVGEVSVRASIGVASARPADVLPSTLLVLADRACLDTKADPGHPIRWSVVEGLAALVEDTEPLPVTVRHSTVMEGPDVVAIKATPRLIEPNGNLIRPGDFLQGVRLAGRLPEVDLAVLRTTLADPDACACGEVIVELSVETLRDRDAIAEIVRLVERADVTVTVDVSERALRCDERSDAGLERLRAAGVRIAVDDFGSGHADVIELVDIVIDEIRLHPRFVDRLADAERWHPVIEALVGVCDRLDVVLTAKGVATEQQRAAFESLGASRWQGPLADDLTPAGIALAF